MHSSMGSHACKRAAYASALCCALICNPACPADCVCLCVALQRPGAASVRAGAARFFRPPACSRACAPALQPNALPRNLRLLLLGLGHRPDAQHVAGPSRLPSDLATNKARSSLPVLARMA